MPDPHTTDVAAQIAAELDALKEIESVRVELIPLRARLWRYGWTELLACRARIANQREQLAGMEAALLKERERAEAYRLAYESQKRRRQKLMARLRAAQTTIGAQQQYTERLEAEVQHG